MSCRSLPLHTAVLIVVTRGICSHNPMWNGHGSVPSCPTPPQKHTADRRETLPPHTAKSVARRPQADYRRLLEARSESDIAVINAPNVFIATANARETGKRIRARSESEIAAINDHNVFVLPTAVRHFLRTPQKVSHRGRKQTIEDCLKPDPSQKSLLSMLLTFS